jgi:hypothetical protein
VPTLVIETGEEYIGLPADTGTVDRIVEVNVHWYWSKHGTQGFCSH